MEGSIQEEFEWFLKSSDEAKKWFKGILDSIYDGVLIADAESVVRYINPEYTRITGVKRDTIIGRPLTDVRPGAILPQVIKSGVPMGGVYRCVGEVEYVVDMAPIFINEKVAGGVSIVKDITEVRRLHKEITRFEKRTSRLKKLIEQAYKAKYTFDDLVGDSQSIKDIIQFAKKIALGETDILITGESGTGKEIFAQAIHNSSKRSLRPFVALNCASLTPTLVESELFGYEEGAFTGAKKGGKTGLFEVADGGTILLDEIGELSLEIQAKLLRVLQERAIRKVGESTEITINVRVIAATNRNLKRMVEEGRFRADLFYRLNVLNVCLPPLREREKDAIPLAEHFLALYSRRIGREYSFAKDSFYPLINYNWPGNIRELRNTVEFAANMCEDSIISREHLPPAFLLEGNGGEHRSLAELVQEAEKKIIVNALKIEGNTLAGKKKVAEQLGISLATLYNKLK
ncbi:Arginine utilization regulatory protein RocR [Sporomusa rhizae]|uniref:sigma-54 interaction domain-containing protein n=1 Tax=Sporomusa rhizae TaxID=357999 RepID=UPI00352A589F